MYINVYDKLKQFVVFRFVNDTTLVQVARGGCSTRVSLAALGNGRLAPTLPVRVTRASNNRRTPRAHADTNTRSQCTKTRDTTGCRRDARAGRTRTLHVSKLRQTGFMVSCCFFLAAMPCLDDFCNT